MSVSLKETLIVIAGSLTFLLLQGVVVGILPHHLMMIGLFCLLFFIHPLSRKWAVMMIPFILFEISYDWMRLYPNYMVNDIDIRGIFEAEKALFGISTEQGTIILGEFFNTHNWAVADLLAGFFYLLWVPGPIAFALWLFCRGDRNIGARFNWCFLFMNLIGFIGYYIHPAAPPWYALDFGFEPDFTTPGNVAGLARFDALVGAPIFESIYVNNSNIFAAVPSLHSAYMLLTTLYAIGSRQPRWVITTCAVITVGIWATAVYSCHHYVIDVLLGIGTAFLGFFLFEGGLMRIPLFRTFIQKLTQYIS